MVRTVKRNLSAGRTVQVDRRQVLMVRTVKRNLSDFCPG